MRWLIHITVAGLLLSGCTTLHTAAKKGNIKAIDRLIEDGEDLNLFDEEGMSPLSYAIMYNQKESFNSLLNAGADINLQDPSNGNTPLHEAIMAGNRYFISQLLAKGADPKIKNHNGFDAVMVAKKKNNPVLMALFVSDKVQSIEETIKPSIVVQKNVEPMEIIKQEEPKQEEPKSIVKQPIESGAAKTIVIPKNASSVLEKMIERRETLGIRNYLDQYPEALGLIKEVRQQVRYVGPSGMRIIDILEIKQNRKMTDDQIIQKISLSGKDYKKFTLEEKDILGKYGISSALINAMENVTK